MILGTIAIRSIGGKIWDALKSVPWPVYAALALALLWLWDRGQQYDAGRESVMVELREAEAKAAVKSLEAIAEADENKAARAEKEAEIVGELIERVEQAEANDENPIDALFR